MKNQKFMKVTCVLILSSCVYILTNTATAQTVMTSGACDNSFWQLTDNGILTISGSGAMRDYSPFDHAPWFSMRAKINKIVIENGVSSIGCHAFEECYAALSITIPTSVKTFGLYAFSGCRSLTTIDIPASVTSTGIVECWAFAACSNLTAINVDADNQHYSSIEGILYNKAQDTFIACPAGKAGAVTISSSVISIGIMAFDFCKKITAINVNSNNQYYSSIDGLLYSKLQDTLKMCPPTKFAINIPKTVTAIHHYALSGCNVLKIIDVNTGNQHYSSINGLLYNKRKTCLIACPLGRAGLITIPNSIDSIGKEAFLFCTKLTSVIISKSVTSIGERAFFGCPLTSIICKAAIPPKSESGVENAFGSELNHIPVYVPCNSMLTYQNSDWGNYFTNIACDTSTENTEWKEINLYPNLVTDYIYISGIGNKAKVEIFNMAGYKVMIANDDSAQAINVSTLPKGMYFVKIGKFTEKFIKE